MTLPLKGASDGLLFITIVIGLLFFCCGLVEYWFVPTFCTEWNGSVWDFGNVHTSMDSNIDDN